MKPFKPICVDDVLDTTSLGKVIVQDLFVSPRTQKIVYQVACLEEDGTQSMVAITTEDELRVK